MQDHMVKINTLDAKPKISHSLDTLLAGYAVFIKTIKTATIIAIFWLITD